MPAYFIEKILIYPVKSLGGMSVPDARITASGSLAGDREWIVTRPDGSMLWQGDIPRMSMLSARLEANKLILLGHDGLVGPQPRDEPCSATTVRQYGHLLPGVDQGDAIAMWLSAQLGSACRLVRVGFEAHKWAGLNPIHLVSTASLSALNGRLAERGEAAIAVERFRPNVVLSGTHEAFAEETAMTLEFEGTTLALREPCVRCELPNINPEDGTRGKQPLKLVGAMSRERPSARPASFGTYCSATGHSLRVGMTAH